MKLRLFLIAKILRVKKFQLDKNLLIFSDPRGGSTWLMELLLEIPDTTAIWEPLHLQNGVSNPDFKLGWRPYIPEYEKREDLKRWFNKILTGKLNNHWTLKFSNIKSALKSTTLIIKFVRLNSMLPWLTLNFKFNKKPIYLLRHPLAVASSQLKTFHKTRNFEKYKIPDVIYNEKYKEHYEFLSKLTSQFEILVAEWCLHNNMTIHHPRAGKDWIVVYYEHLFCQPEKELNRIFLELSIKMPDTLANKVRTPSQSDFNEDFNKNSIIQLGKWQSEISQSDIEKAESILNHFNITIYNTSSYLPQLHV